MLLPSRDTGPHEVRSMAEIAIMAHMMVFFLGGYLFYTFKPDLAAHPFHLQFLLLFLAAFTAGIFVEGLQSMIPGRTASLRDIGANITGAMIFLSLKNWNNITRYIPFHVSVIAITAIFLWPFFRSVTDEVIAHSQFPLLAGFETPFEDTRFIRGTGRFSISNTHAFYGGNSLQVKMGTQAYSGFALEYMPRNWRGYSYLQFAVYNPQEDDVTIHTRIHDTWHANSGRMIYADRFNRIFHIPPQEWTVIKIPLEEIKNAPRSRKMDMAKITNMGFYVAREPDPLTLYIDDIRLLR